MNETSISGLVVIYALFALFVVVMFIIRNTLLYARLKKRDRDMQALAEDFGLAFQSKLPSMFKLGMNPMVKDITLNLLTGKYNGHDVKIEDVYYGGMLNRFGTRGYRRTRLIIDGQQIPNTPPLGFNELLFSPVAALRDHLKRFVK